ncbi:MAG: hypothetical protein HQK62_14375 [Desulfamplus sp.]|nr:hypothetical protein [Desulfamplus sp.]
MPFTCGNAYLIKFMFTKPAPKEKFVVCVCDIKPLFLFISSNPRTRFDINSQLKVFPVDLPFLKRASFINLAECITCVVPHNCTIVKDFGVINEVIRSQIKSRVLNSETLPQRFIDKIINNL